MADQKPTQEHDSMGDRAEKPDAAEPKVLRGWRTAEWRRRAQSRGSFVFNMGEARYDGEEPIIGILLDAAGRIPDSALPEIWALLTPGAREPLIRVSKGERMALVDTAGAAERARVIAAVRDLLAGLER